MSVVTAAEKPLQLDPTLPVHFVGIGGVGMSGLARILAESGYTVSGSDAAENDYTRQLQALGVRIFVGHQADQVPETGILIVSSSINSENPEIRQALDRGLSIHHRSHLLAALMTLHRTQIGITGTHGKTSVTGMTGLALRAAGLTPSIIVGGKMPELKTNATSDPEKIHAVAELDESDGTIVQYQPELSLINNLELDHADHYTNGLQGVMDTFRQYIGALKPGSKVFYNVSCPNTKQLAEEVPEHVEPILLAPGEIFTGQEKQTTYWLKNARPYHHGCYQGYVYRNTRMLGELSMSVPGRHNLFNGLCAVAIGDQLGCDFDEMAQSLNKFSGMGRRFEKVGEFNSALLVDDYAHHPTEVSATLKAAKESLYGDTGRVIAVFQPHRFTRLKALWDEFCECFDQADVVILTDVYAAHEPPIEGVTSERLARCVLNVPETRYVSLDKEFQQLRQVLKSEIRPGDIVLSMGAGNITHLLRNWESS